MTYDSLNRLNFIAPPVVGKKSRIHKVNMFRCFIILNCDAVKRREQGKYVNPTDEITVGL